MKKRSEKISGVILDGFPEEYMEECLNFWKNLWEKSEGIHRGIFAGISDEFCEWTSEEFSGRIVARCNTTRNCKEMSAGMTFFKESMEEHL